MKTIHGTWDMEHYVALSGVTTIPTAPPHVSSIPLDDALREQVSSIPEIHWVPRWYIIVPTLVCHVCVSSEIAAVTFPGQHFSHIGLDSSEYSLDFPAQILSENPFEVICEHHVKMEMLFGCRNRYSFTCPWETTTGKALFLFYSFTVDCFSVPPPRQVGMLTCGVCNPSIPFRSGSLAEMSLFSRLEEKWNRKAIRSSQPDHSVWAKVPRWFAGPMKYLIRRMNLKSFSTSINWRQRSECQMRHSVSIADDSILKGGLCGWQHERLSHFTFVSYVSADKPHVAMDLNAVKYRIHIGFMTGAMLYRSFRILFKIMFWIFL